MFTVITLICYMHRKLLLIQNIAKIDNFIVWSDVCLMIRIIQILVNLFTVIIYSCEK